MTWIMLVMKTGKKGERYDLKILVILFNKRKGAETYNSYKKLTLNTKFGIFVPLRYLYFSV